MEVTESVSLVGEIRRHIAESIGQQRFALWLADAKLDLDDDLLQVGVANLFVQEWLQTKFADLLAHVSSEVVGKPVHVKFHVDGELFRKMRRKQTAPGEAGHGKALDDVSPESPRASARLRRRKATLRDFVVGPCNRLAYAAAVQVADAPGQSFNPLFIHGSTGLGKTHLLAGIEAEVAKQHGGARIRFVSAEAFTNEFLQALRGNAMDGFRARYRKLDVLIVDDIQFLASKSGTQEEFLHTFDALENAGRQVIVAGESHPKTITQMSDQLVNRFLAGMVCRLEPPAADTRVEILKAKAAKLEKPYPRSVLRYIAENLRGSVRELDGAMNYLAAYSGLAEAPVTLAMAREALADMVAQSVRAVQIKDIEELVCAHFGLEPKELRSRKRVRSISYPRMIAMYLSRRHTQTCYAGIGKYFGNKNHSTVMSAEKTVVRWIEEGKTVRIGAQQCDVRRVVQRLQNELTA